MQTDFLLQTTGERSAPVSTLCDLFDRAVAAAPEKVALRHRGRALSYREMGRAVVSLARRLESIVAPGDIVALVLPNSIEFQIAYFAALKALATPALLNPAYPAAELIALLRDVTPRAILCGPATRETLAGLADDLGPTTVICLGQDVQSRIL